MTEVETATNTYLEKYFDAELRVSFSLDADSLDATIHKNGYECIYKQLSKGQRGLLKLCFSVAVQQAVSDNKGVRFDNLFYDESLDGYDDNLKIKAFRLFEELAQGRESLLVIDHNVSFQQLFHTVFTVSMEGDHSVLEQS